MGIQDIIEMGNNGTAIVTNTMSVITQLSGIFTNYKKQSVTEKDALEQIEKIFRHEESRLKNDINNHCLRKDLFAFLIQKKITNPKDDNGFHKSNWVFILETLWLYSDKENDFFEKYSQIDTKNNEYQAKREEFKNEYLGFFLGDFLDYVEYGVDYFTTNIKYQAYIDNPKTKQYSNLFKEALRILQSEEYIVCIGDGISQREVFKNIAYKVSSFFD